MMKNKTQTYFYLIHSIIVSIIFEWFIGKGIRKGKGIKTINMGHCATCCLLLLLLSDLIRQVCVVHEVEVEVVV